MENKKELQNRANPIIELTENERALIESQRQETLKLETFQRKYQELVQETGYAWAIDLQSPLGSPKLGITKVR